MLFGATKCSLFGEVAIPVKALLPTKRPPPVAKLSFKPHKSVGYYSIDIFHGQTVAYHFMTV